MPRDTLDDAVRPTLHRIQDNTVRLINVLYLSKHQILSYRIRENCSVSATPNTHTYKTNSQTTAFSAVSQRALNMRASSARHAKSVSSLTLHLARKTVRKNWKGCIYKTRIYIDDLHNVLKIAHKLLDHKFTYYLDFEGCLLKQNIVVL